MPNVPSRPLPPPLLSGEAGELKLHSTLKVQRDAVAWPHYVWEVRSPGRTMTMLYSEDCIINPSYLGGLCVILAGKADKLAFVLQETGCGTIIELFKANA